jgi:hypothetical protein
MSARKRNKTVENKVIYDCGNFYFKYFIVILGSCIKEIFPETALFLPTFLIEVNP